MVENIFNEENPNPSSSS